MMKTGVSVAQVAAVMKKDHRVGSQTLKKTGIPKIIAQQFEETEDLHKVCATAKQCNQSVVYTCDVLEMVKNDPEFLDSIITGDESWCFVYNPKTEHQRTNAHLGARKILRESQNFVPKN